MFFYTAHYSSVLPWLTFFFIGLIAFLLFFRRVLLRRLKQYSFALFNNLTEQSTEHFLLSETGEYQTDVESIYQLTAQSHSNFLGHWLLYVVKTDDNIKNNLLFLYEKNQKKDNKKVYKRFIFKDSLSTQDQARLARIIKRVRQG